MTPPSTRNGAPREASIEIRPATAADAPALAELLGHLGYPADPGDVPARLERLRAANDDALIALVAGAGNAPVRARRRPFTP